MNLRSRIVQLIAESGLGFVEKNRTIYTTCPSCGRDDKFSVLKENGACICYHGSCEFGKRWFADWVSLTFGVTMAEAKQMISQTSREEIDINPTGDLSDIELMDVFSGDIDESESLLKDIEEIKYPEFHMTPIDDKESLEGLQYLQGRGITLELAQKYNISYSKFYRRVYLPITMYGKTYGYQGRHIDKVEDGLRIRNNEGFRRETLVMFSDNLIGSDKAILAEGPFDALKFELVGSNICTMGKVVTDKQLAIIKSYGINELYLALDDDAAHEMSDIIEKVNVKTFKINVPSSCIERCRVNNKKADFGECTFEEAKQAFIEAKPIGKSDLLIYVK